MSKRAPSAPSQASTASAAQPEAKAPTQASATPSHQDSRWTVRPARHSDAGGVAAAVISLLLELGAKPPPAGAVKQVAEALIEDEQAAIVLLAESGGEIIGVLGASLQSAMHVPGRYALIQDLWVKEDWRSRQVGRALVDALCEIAKPRGLLRLEVGLPKEEFPRLQATEAFYLRNGFDPLGPRMRRLLR